MQNHVSEGLELLVPIPSGDRVSTNLLPQLSVCHGALPCTSKKNQAFYWNKFKVDNVDQ